MAIHVDYWRVRRSSHEVAGVASHDEVVVRNSDKVRMSRRLHYFMTQHAVELDVASVSRTQLHGFGVREICLSSEARLQNIHNRFSKC